MTYSLSMFANRLVGERARTSPSPSSCDLNNNFWQRSSGLREGLGRQRPSRAPVGMVRLRIGQRASGLTRDLGTAAAFLFVWKRALGSVLSLEKSCINRRKKKISLGKLLRTMFQGPWGGNRKEFNFPMEGFACCREGRWGGSHCWHSPGRKSPLRRVLEGVQETWQVF